MADQDFSSFDANQVLKSVYQTGTSSLKTYSLGSFVPEAFDSLTKTDTSATVETYEYYTGGLSGTKVATLTITYTDSSKANLASVERT